MSKKNMASSRKSSRRKLIQYSTEDKVKYHLSRKDQKDRKGSYSRSWLDGFSDSYAAHNVSAYDSEYKSRRRQGIKFNNYDALLLAARKGCSTRLKDVDKARSLIDKYNLNKF